MKKCIIVSGAPNYEVEYLKDKLNCGEYIIAADLGYKACLDCGIIPDLIIGDFDSATKPNIDTEIITLQVEKAHTDTFSCVIEAVNRGFNEIDIYNALGSRFDHSFANVLMLSYCLNNSVSCRIINEKNRISLIDKSAKINREYNNFSLFAFIENVVGLKIEGAYYTAGFYDKDKLNIKQDDLITQCNYVTDDFATISIESGKILIVESND